MWNLRRLQLRSLALSAVAGVSTAAWIGNAAVAAPKSTVPDGKVEGSTSTNSAAKYVVNTDNATFQELAKRNSVMIGPVSLREGPHGRGLFTDHAVTEGTLLIRVPMDLCLIHQHGDDKKQDRDWPFWLATRVLRETSASIEVSDQTEPKFWPQYSELFFPSIEEAKATIPSAMPLAWLEKFRHWGIVQQLYSYRMHSQKLFKSITGSDNVPESFTCAQALVLSRCFGLSQTRGTISLIPFIDMLNHTDPGNTKLRLDADRGQIYAYASKDIGPDEEICTSYADKAPNALLFMKFGFVAENNPHASLLMGAKERKNFVNPTRLMKFLDENMPGWDRRSDKQFVAILDSLSVDETAKTSIEVEISATDTLVSLLQHRADRIRQDVAEGELGPLNMLVEETLGILDRAVALLSAYNVWLQKTQSAK